MNEDEDASDRSGNNPARETVWARNGREPGQGVTTWRQIDSPSSVPILIAVRTRRRWLNSIRVLGLIACIIATSLIALLSLRYGSLALTTRDAWNALFHYTPESYEQTIVRSLRLPRTVIAPGIGAALAVAGTIMQAVTRNPLADPSILGVSSGASFGVVTAIFFLGLTAPAQYIWFAFGGALVASILVFAIGSSGRGGRGGVTPVKLALAGVVISSLLSAWTSALLLPDRNTMDIVRFWSAGSVALDFLDDLALPHRGHRDRAFPRAPVQRHEHG